jgi:hypothetical protein
MIECVFFLTNAQHAWVTRESSTRLSKCGGFTPRFHSREYVPKSQRPIAHPTLTSSFLPHELRVFRIQHGNRGVLGASPAFLF